MMRFVFIFALAAFSALLHAKGASFAAGPSGTSAGGPTVRGGGGGRALRDPRHAPPLDPTRKVTEQDCSKPVDLSSGNLRCK